MENRKPEQRKKEQDKVQEQNKAQEQDQVQGQNTEQGISLEEAFAQLEEVIAHLETEEITLEQSFQEYNRGMQLLQYCNATIDQVEKRVLQINEDGGLDEF